MARVSSRVSWTFEKSWIVAAVAVAVVVVLVASAAAWRRCDGFVAQEKWPGGLALVIVEPRAHEDLEAVLRNVHGLSPAHAKMYVVHGTGNAAFAARAARRALNDERPCTLVKIPYADLTPDQYNALFKTREFWETFQEEHVLVFQTDAALCRSSPYSLADFREYGYVGCSYGTGRVGPDAGWGPEASFYGVGGLSMRRRSAMLRCIEDGTPEDNTPEDVFFSTCMDRVALPEGVRKPESDEVLQRFCTQNAHLRPALGAHQVALSDDAQRAKFRQHCPEASWLVDHPRFTGPPAFP